MSDHFQFKSSYGESKVTNTGRSITVSQDRGISVVQQDTNNILDVMFLFTPQALAAVGGSESSMVALAIYSVQLANDAYANSHIPLRMRMVGTFLVADPAYVEAGFQDALNHLRNADGVLDDDVARRTAVGADSVVLFVSDSSYCGLSVQWASGDQALAVVSTQCPSSVVHEIGHNVGCQHDRLTEGNNNENVYNFGYCWDTSATTCSRSVMAYGGCMTPNKRTNCPQVPYFSSPLVTYGVIGKTTGLGTADNARFVTEQVSRVINWAPSKLNGGLVFAAQPSNIAVGRCEPVAVQGWRLGNGSNIESVTLNGVPVQRILSQTIDSVQVLAGLGTSAGVGDIVVTTSAGYSTTLSGSFAYAATSGLFVSDFDTDLGPYWTPGGALLWSVERYCDALPCFTPPDSGPSVGAAGAGNFAKLSATDVSGEAGMLTAIFNANEHGCVEAVHSVGLQYHTWNPYATQCGGSLTVSMQSLSTGAWSTILAATARQANQDDPWLPLQYFFPTPQDVRAVRITATPFTGAATCKYWSSVSVDHLVLNKTTTCVRDGCDLKTMYPTVVPSVPPTQKPTLAPTSVAPSTVPTATPTFTLVEAVEVVTFTTTLLFTGVSTIQFLTQPSVIVTLLHDVATAIGVTPDALCCVEFSEYPSRELLSVELPGELRVAVAYITRLSVAYVAPSNVLGAPANSPSAVGLQAFAASSRLLEESVSSGDLLNTLTLTLPLDTIRGVGLGPLTSDSFSAPLSTMVAASSSPTTAPSPAFHAAGSGLDTSLSWSGVYIGIGLLVLVCVCSVLLVLACRSKGSYFKWSKTAAELSVEHVSELELTAMSTHNGTSEEGSDLYHASETPRNIRQTLPAYIEALVSPRLLSRSRSASTPRNQYQQVSVQNTDDPEAAPYQDILDRVNDSHNSVRPEHMSSPLHRSSRSSTPRSDPVGSSQVRMPRSVPLPFPPSIALAGAPEHSLASARGTPINVSRDGSPRSAPLVAPQQAFRANLVVDTNGAPILLLDGSNKWSPRGLHGSPASHGVSNVPSTTTSSSKFNALLAKRLESPNAVADFSPTSNPT